MHTRLCLSLNLFYKGFYKRDNKDIHYADSVSSNLSHRVTGVFLSIHD
jgi:hypothetical protein